MEEETISEEIAEQEHIPVPFIDTVGNRDDWRKNAKTYRPTYKIEIERIKVLERTLEDGKIDRFNPRSLENVMDGIEELADNMVAVGQLEPLEGDLSKDGATFFLRHGERRLRAMILARTREGYEAMFDMVEVRPYPVGMSEADKLIANLSTDFKKKYKGMDLANGLYRLKKDCKLSNEEIGQKLGMSRQWVDNYIALVEKLEDDDKGKIVSGELTVTRAIKQIHEKTKQADEFHGVIGKSNQQNSDNVFIPKENDTKPEDNFGLFIPNQHSGFADDAVDTSSSKEDALPSTNFENFKTEQEDWVNQVAKSTNKIEALGKGLNDGAQKDLEREMWIIRKNVDALKIYFGAKMNKDVSKFVTIDTINQLIKLVDANHVSDGYHTFGELYKHRIALFIALCKELDFNQQVYYVWKSKLHSNGTGFKGWFILGINEDKGKQITYRLPDEYWDQVEFADELAKAPEWDGHTSDDVLERIKNI